MLEYHILGGCDPEKDFVWIALPVELLKDWLVIPVGRPFACRFDWDVKFIWLRFRLPARLPGVLCCPALEVREGWRWLAMLRELLVRDGFMFCGRWCWLFKFSAST